MIVVLAIMAILVGVLAPIYLHYVEKARKQKDDTAAGEIRHAAEIVVLSGTYTISDGAVLVTYDVAHGVQVSNTDAGNELYKHLVELFGDLSEIKPESRAYRNKTYTVTITAPPEGALNGIPEVTGSWSS